ncbi:MAG TPA: substrate-binding domain-containing protein [Acetobacteraceae bacterium]|jgi:LacI family transcriptional regulator|nr:substrate-binding domain-containing protein [Acetobacteraceae bacterium]
MSGSERSGTAKAMRRRPRRSANATVRLEDVARLAGVSTASVSRALNAPDLVSTVLRERILHAAQELKWVPNGAAKALASLRTRTVGVMIPTLSHQNFATLIEALQHDLAAAHYTLILCCMDATAELRLQQARTLVERGVECLVLVGEAHPDTLFELLRSQSVPYVITYTKAQDPRHTCIGFDNYDASTRLTEHLLELGHRAFAMVAHESDANDRIQQRIAAVQDALARSGIAIRPQHFVRVNSRHIASGREGMRKILIGDSLRPTALICTNDYIATGAMIEAKGLGLEIPRDLSIVGFDDTDMAAHLDPPLTTVRVPSRRMGEEIARYIIAYLERGAAVVPPPIEAELIIRGSTAGPARRSDN